jgi:inhibitor of KinA
MESMYTKQDFNFTTLGRTLILDFSYHHDERSFHFIQVLSTVLSKQFNKQLEDSTTTFNSINLFFKEDFQIEKIKSTILKTIDVLDFKKANPIKLWKLPICVDEQYTVDVHDFFNGDIKQVNAYIDRFLSLEFHLVFYGFLPGFPYLGGLPAEMAIPRKATPSRLTQKGSVAVGGDQVGIYPQDSPGGWNVVGNCPIPMMDFTKNPPNHIEPADRIQFFEISTAEHVDVATALEQNRSHPFLKPFTHD